MNNKQRKSLLSLALALSLGTVILSGSAYAANTGGIPDKPYNGDYVGSTDGSTVATENAKVTIDTSVAGSVYGGYAEDTTAVKNNTVTVTGATVATVYGGKSLSGNVTGNSVNISHTSSANEVMGGFTSGTGKAIGNSVNISGAGTNITSTVYGGCTTGSGDVIGNSVNISGGTMNSVVFGGYSYDGSKSGDATGNSVTITGGKLKDDVCGGNSFNGDATGNSVTITGGTIDSGVLGGRGNNATDNIVTITGGTFSTGTYLFGGTGGSGDQLTGNTLNWGHKASIGSVENFANYNFIIPEGAKPGDTLLTVTGIPPGGGNAVATDLSKSTVKLAGINGSRKLSVGETVVLIDNGANTIAGVDSKLEDKFIKGIKRYDYEIEKIDSDKKLQATITGAGASEQAKSLSEGRIAAIGFINSAADLASGAALNNAMSSGSKYDLFGAMNYRDSKYKSGSHADVKGSSFLLGFARNMQSNKSKWTLGAFLESGNSSYETFNSFADAGDVHANGKNNYVGGGIMARNSQDSGMYYEGSLRFGRMSSDYNSTDIDTKYDIKSTYYGAHLGLGKIFKINKSNDIDVYGKYFWSHQNSATASIDGEAFNFDSINSNRLRIGARLNMLGGGHGIKTYVGLAYEHEFSGSARASYSGESIAAPSIKGATGVGEIGMVYKPSGKSAFSMDVGLNGYVGKRQGIGGGIKLNWGF